MEWERKVLQTGGSLCVPLPKDLITFLGLEKGSEVIITDTQDVLPDGFHIAIRKKEPC